MPPPGGARSSVNISYGWGTPGNLSGNQDIASRFSAQFQPNSALFSPNFPLVPVESELTRLWDYPTGYNLQYTPRSYEPVNFAELRALASNESLTRMAIETRKDQIEKLTWEIKPRDEKNSAKDLDARIKALMRLWERPDGDRPFATWLREALEDVLVIDAPCFEVLKNRDGSLRGLDIVDGSTISLLIDITGRRPTPPAPAYRQVIHGRPWRLFAADELLYLPRNKRPGHIYGYSPVEQILMFINIALRRQVMQLSYFTESNVPRGFLNTPDLSPQQVAQLQQYIDDLLAGNLAERSKLHMLPYATKWQAIKDPPLKDEFDEWLARVVMFCFSLPPDAFVRMRSRATSETAKQTALEEGLAPLMGWVKRLIDGVIQVRMGHDDLEFAWQEIKETDPEVQEKVLTSYVKTGIYTPNEARDELGLDEIEGGDDAIIVAGATVMMLTDVEKISDLQANPPAPMFPMGGPPGLGKPGGPPGGAGGPPRGNSPGGARGAQQPGNSGQPQKPAGKPAGAQNGGRASKVAGEPFLEAHEAASGPWAQRSEDGGGAAEDAIAARRLLRRARAARVEADLRANAGD